MPPRAVSPACELVLFDLDGTLVDSAPDLAGAANDLRIERGLPPLPYEQLRPVASAGARGLIGAAFGLSPGDADFPALRDAFLERYAERLLSLTRVFDAVDTLLAALDSGGWPWGIVTNKAMRFTAPIVAGLGLADRAAAVVAGDSTPHIKPHPAPLLHAARTVGVDPCRCAYVGDDLRDVQAGRAAGMATLVASWGYLGQGEPIDAWGADRVLGDPIALLNWLEPA